MRANHAYILEQLTFIPDEDLLWCASIQGGILMQALSMDLRERIVESYEAGHPSSQARSKGCGHGRKKGSVARAFGKNPDATVLEYRDALVIKCSKRQCGRRCEKWAGASIKVHACGRARPSGRCSETQGLACYARIGGCGSHRSSGS